MQLKLSIFNWARSNIDHGLGQPSTSVERSSGVRNRGWETGKPWFSTRDFEGTDRGPPNDLLTGIVGTVKQGVVGHLVVAGYGGCLRVLLG
jgi:hypothetical protein